jgi:flagellar biosynthesis/type III secretory pathway M-ring protein FliF/YscJ
MDWWIIRLIVLGVVVLAAAFVASRRARERQLASRREEAGELRTTAEEQANRADQRASLAEEEAERASRERAEAEERLRRADELDPDVDVDAAAERSDAER